MKSIKELYRIGTGPSSSHTMGPRKAAEMFVERHPDATSFKVTLYGSLAATGKGHMTDVAIIDTLQPVAPVEIVWQPKVFLPFHPNGMTFAALDASNKILENWTDLAADFYRHPFHYKGVADALSQQGFTSAKSRYSV